MGRAARSFSRSVWGAGLWGLWLDPVCAMPSRGALPPPTAPTWPHCPGGSKWLWAGIKGFRWKTPTAAFTAGEEDEAPPAVLTDVASGPTSSPPLSPRGCGSASHL